MLEDRTLLSLAAPNITAPTGTVTTDMPEFSWLTVSGADHYDLWVNDLTTGQSGIIRETNVAGTAFTSSAALPNGHQYIWTVRAIDSAGTAGAWAPHRTFSISAVPGQPTLTTPVDTTGSIAPTFEWTAVSGAAYYDIWVNNLTTAQSGVIRNTAVSGASYTSPIALPDGNDYIWTVRGISSLGQVGEWATHATFSIDMVSPPTLILPSGTPSTRFPDFEWTVVPDAARYDIWVNDQTTGTSGIIRDVNVAESHYEPSLPLDLGHDYIWTVRAIYGEDVPGEWAAHAVFSLADTDLPGNLAPEGTSNGPTPTFSWTGVTDAVRYELLVHNATTGERAVIHQTSLKETSYTVRAPLTTGHTYVWSVRTIDLNGDAGAWAGEHTFTVADAAIEADSDDGPNDGEEVDPLDANDELTESPFVHVDGRLEIDSQRTGRAEAFLPADLALPEFAIRPVRHEVPNPSPSEWPSDGRRFTRTQKPRVTTEEPAHASRPAQTIIDRVMTLWPGTEWWTGKTPIPAE